MGLAAPRKRVKLSHDPNNTKWTRDTGGFGHKIMTAQGWRPGDILGAKNASHAEFHTAANVSHIRVFVRDDNLGLGAKKGSGLLEGECTGLDVFQNLLGRLNGKDEQVLMNEQKSREDLKRAIYTERRWGSIRFVKGGFLIGDKIQESIDNEEGRVRQLDQNSSNALVELIETGSSQNTEEAGSKRMDVNGKRNKKKRQRFEKLKDESATTDIEKDSKSDHSIILAQNAVEETPSILPKKSKKKQKRSERGGERSDVSVSEEQDGSRKAKQKKKKRQKEGTASEQAVERGSTTDNTSISQNLRSASGSSTPQSLVSGRHAVRSRNIAQKRLAVLDTASLNQIFMIKK